MPPGVLGVDVFVVSVRDRRVRFGEARVREGSQATGRGRRPARAPTGLLVAAFVMFGALLALAALRVDSARVVPAHFPVACRAFGKLS
jgi:hypothetical protein